MDSVQAQKPFSAEGLVFADDRGVFAPFFDRERTADVAKALGEAKRVYYVHNSIRGVVRGFHYHETEVKLFTIAGGSAKFVALDPNRPEEKFTFVSSVRKNNVIVIPPGYANGWVSLEDNTTLICVSNLTTSESRADDKRFDPYMWGDVWTIVAR